MALTKKDLQNIQDMMSVGFAAQDARLHTALQQQSQDIKRDIRDEMDARFGAFENKMNKEFANIRQEMHQGFSSLRQEMQENVMFLAEIITDKIFPAIERLEKDHISIRAFVGMKI